MSPGAGDDLLAQLNRLLGGDDLQLLDGESLTPDQQQRLQSFLAGLQAGTADGNPFGNDDLDALAQQLDLPTESLDALAAAVQHILSAADSGDSSLSDAQLLDEQSMSLTRLVDILTSGKAVPQDAEAGAINLADADSTADEAKDELADGGLVLLNVGAIPSAPVAPTSSGDELSPAALQTATAGKQLDFSQWIANGDEDIAMDEEGEPVVQMNGVKPSSGLTSNLSVGVDQQTSLEGSLMLSTSDASPGDMAEGESRYATVAGSLASNKLTPANIDVPQAPLNPSMKLQVAFGHAQWSEALAERAAWFAGQQIHTAELQLDPPELGPLQVRISVHHDQAVVSFVSANPQVREALDQSMVRLRELMQEQGMQLVDAGVSDQRRSNEGDSGEAESGEPVNNGLSAEEHQHDAVSPTSVLHTRYGVDDFV